MSRKLLAARAFAKAWEVAEKTPGLNKFAKTMMVLGAKSRVLNHPFVQVNRGFVFIHIPKTAGTSLRQALGLKEPGNSPPHASARELLPFVKEVAPDTLSIAFVRNPYKRFISLYNYARMEESLYHSVNLPDRARYGKHADYDVLLDKSLEQAAELLIQGKLGRPCALAFTPWNAQIEWLIDERGDVKVDFIGHVESIESDLKKLHEHHGIACSAIPWLNRSAPGIDEPELTERTRDLIKLYYKRDFERLGYDENWTPGQGSPLMSQRGQNTDSIFMAASR